MKLRVLYIYIHMTVMLHTEFIAPRIISNHLSVSKPPYLLRPFSSLPVWDSAIPIPTISIPTLTFSSRFSMELNSECSIAVVGAYGLVGVWCVQPGNVGNVKHFPGSGITCLHFLIAFLQSFPIPQTLENPQPPTPASSTSFFSSSRTETISWHGHHWGDGHFWDSFTQYVCVYLSHCNIS